MGLGGLVSQTPYEHCGVARSRERCRDPSSKQARGHHTLSTLSLARAWEWGLEAKQGVQAIQYHKEGKKGRKGWEREVRRTYLYKAKCKIPCAQEIIVT